MSTTGEKGDNGNMKPVSVRVDEDVIEKLDRAIKKAQLEGDILLNASRSDVIRKLLEKAANKPDLITDE